MNPGQPMPSPPPIDTLETRLIRVEALVEDIKELMTEILQGLRAQALQ